MTAEDVALSVALRGGCAYTMPALKRWSRARRKHKYCGDVRRMNLPEDLRINAEFAGIQVAELWGVYGDPDPNTKLALIKAGAIGVL